jgi:hypothetical protein
VSASTLPDTSAVAKTNALLFIIAIDSLSFRWTGTHFFDARAQRMGVPQPPAALNRRAIAARAGCVPISMPLRVPARRYSDDVQWRDLLPAEALLGRFLEAKRWERLGGSLLARPSSLDM